MAFGWMGAQRRCGGSIDIRRSIRYHLRTLPLPTTHPHSTYIVEVCAAPLCSVFPRVSIKHCKVALALRVRVRHQLQRKPCRHTSQVSSTHLHPSKVIDKGMRVLHCPPALLVPVLADPDLVRGRHLSMSSRLVGMLVECAMRVGGAGLRDGDAARIGRGGPALQLVDGRRGLHELLGGLGL